jgi:hypothetical protein
MIDYEVAEKESRKRCTSPRREKDYEGGKRSRVALYEFV